MTQILSKSEAALLLAAILTIVIPYSVSWLKSKDLTWPDQIKFGIAAGLSLLAGLLTAYVEDKFTSNSILENAAVILFAAQGVYYIAFKTLGLERWLFPRNFVASEASHQAKARLQFLSQSTAKALADPQDPTVLNVKVDVAQRVDTGTSTK